METTTEPKDLAIQESILDAAERLFEVYGYRKTTVDEIAQEAGIGKGSIYLHFKSKEEIGVSWLKRLHGGLLGQLEETARDTLAFPADRITKILVTRVLFRFDVFARHRRSLDEAMDSLKECIRERKEEVHRIEAKLISDLIKEGIDKGRMASEDPDRDAESMVIATNALLPYSLKPTQLGDRASVKQRTLAVADLLIRGVALRREL